MTESLTALTAALNNLAGDELNNAIASGQTANSLITASGNVNSNMSKEASTLEGNLQKQTKVQKIAAYFSAGLTVAMVLTSGIGMLADPMAASLGSSLGISEDTMNAVTPTIANVVQTGSLVAQVGCGVGGLVTNSVLAHSQFKTADEQEQILKDQEKISSLGDSSKPLVNAMDSGNKNASAIATAANDIASQEKQQNTAYNS